MAPAPPARPGPARPEVQDAVRSLGAAARAVRIPMRERLPYWLAYMRLARRGTMVHSPTHDAVYEDGPLTRRYHRALERINERLARLPRREAPAPIPVFAADELTEGDLDLLRRSRLPYVARGAASHLPAMDWTLEYLEEGWGHHEGPINQASDEPDPDTSRPTKMHHYYDFRIGTLAEVAASIRAGGKARYVVAQDVMHADDDRLLRDVELESWEPYSGWDRNRHHWLKRRLYVGKLFSAQLLLQPEDAFSLWHTEAGDNFFVLAKGRKRWTLCHPVYTAAMRPRVKKTTNYTGSNIDLRESDEVLESRGFRGYLSIPLVSVELEPGDMLRVPSFWWHTVETLPGEPTIASSMRVESGPDLTAPALLAMRLLDEQTHAMMKAYERDGRITDALIGQPRKSRSA